MTEKSMCRPVRAWVVMAVLCGVQFVDVLGVTSAVTAIPSIVEGLTAPPEVTGLLATVYAAFFGGLLVLGARLADNHGARRVLLIGIGLFTAVAAVAVTAQEIVQLLVGIALQGAAAALSVPAALRLLLHVADPAEARRSALAAWGATGAAAGVLGYVVGGVLTEVFGWRAIYAVNLPIGLALLAAVATLVPAGPGADRRGRLDLAGAALLISAVMAVIIGASLLELPSLRWVGLGCLAAGALLTVALAYQQRRAATPLVPPAAVRSPNLRTGSLMSFVNTATTSSAGVLATLLLQHELGLRPLQAALSLMPFSLAVIAGSALTRPLATRLTDWRMGGLGLGGVAAGNLVLALTAGSVGGLVVGVAIAGGGLGVAIVAANSIGTHVDDQLTASAAGLLNTAGQLGTALGVAALVTLASVTDPITGTALAWAAAGAAAAAAAVVVARHPTDEPAKRAAATSST